jgi:hypothetical protein
VIKQLYPSNIINPGMSSDMDTEMNEDDNECDPVDNYPLVLGPLSLYPETLFGLVTEYQTAQQRAEATHQEEAEVVPDDGDEDENPNDSDKDSTGSSSSGYGRQDYTDDSDHSDHGSSSGFCGRRGRRVVRPSRSVTDIEVTSSREEATQAMDRNVNNYDGGNGNDSGNMSVDGENAEQEIRDNIGKTARRMVEFGVAGIDRLAETRYGIDMKSHEVSLDWIQETSQTFSYRMDFDSLIGRCDRIPWVGAFQLFPLFKKGFPITHSLHIGPNMELGGYKVCFSCCALLVSFI